MKNSKNSQTTAAGFLNAALKAGVAALAISSGAAPANARRLTASGLLPNANPNYPNYTNDAAARGNCSAALSAATQKPVKVQKHHVDLTGCQVPITKTADGNVTCNQTAGRAIPGLVRLREGGNRSRLKIAENARTILNILNCKNLQKIMRDQLKAAGLDYKKNPEAYKNLLRAAIVAKIKEHDVEIDGFSLVLEEGVAGAEKCLLPSKFPKGSKPRVAILINPQTCEVLAMQPMIESRDCAEVCEESGRLYKKYGSSGPLGIGGR